MSTSSTRTRNFVCRQSWKSIEFDSVLMQEGEFSVEGDLVEPTLFSITISQAAYRYLIGAQSLPVILEPGVNYRVVPLGKEETFAVLADRESLHSQLISSWQLDCCNSYSSHTRLTTTHQYFELKQNFLRCLKQIASTERKLLASGERRP